MQKQSTSEFEFLLLMFGCISICVFLNLIEFACFAAHRGWNADTATSALFLVILCSLLGFIFYSGTETATAKGGHNKATLAKQAQIFAQMQKRQSAHNVSPKWKQNFKPLCSNLVWWLETQQDDSPLLISKSEFWAMGREFCKQENIEPFESAFAEAWKCFPQSKKYQGGETKKRRDEFLNSEN